MAFTTYTNRRTLPFDVWVKDKLCRNCNEVGHIQRDCPKSLRHPPRAPKSHRSHSKQESSRQTHYGGSSVPPKKFHTPPVAAPSTKEYASKVQALISAACDLALTTTQNANEMAPATTTDDNQSPPHDYSGFLAALGCPKE